MKHPISVLKMASISAAGHTQDEIWNAYTSGKSRLFKTKIGNTEIPAGLLGDGSQSIIDALHNENETYKNLDESVIYAIHTARQLLTGNINEKTIGINFGSSRGATKSMEHHHAHFIEHDHCHSLSSPSTTLGNISSWVAHDLGIDGPTISHSITCSTALHSLLNGVAWLQSDMVDRFIVGGSESAITPFTVAQMLALRIYSSETSPYACLTLDMTKKKNTMVLGDAASAMLLAKGENSNAIAKITGMGYATEALTHNVSISTDAKCFQKSMAMCLKNNDIKTVDAIVTHAPGTIKGDKAEINAIKNIFGTQIPALTSNKWCIGHTFGASGLMSLEFAIMMILYQKFVAVPYLKSKNKPRQLNNIMVNAVGFGGNAVSILISRNN